MTLFWHFSRKSGFWKKGGQIFSEKSRCKWYPQMSKMTFFRGPGRGKMVKSLCKPLFGTFWGSKSWVRKVAVNGPPKKTPKNRFSLCRFFLKTIFKPFLGGVQKGPYFGVYFDHFGHFEGILVQNGQKGVKNDPFSSIFIDFDRFWSKMPIFSLFWSFLAYFKLFSIRNSQNSLFLG
jgi:hypothetical protein